MPRSSRIAKLGVLMVAIAVGGCEQPLNLSPPEEALVRRCLELVYRQESDAECSQKMTPPMQKAFLAKHPDFYDQLLASRKTFVEERIAEDRRRRDELDRCLDDREAGTVDSPSCEKQMQHEITRGLEDRRRRRCAAARLEDEADSQDCAGLSQSDIADEVRMERARRERSSQKD